MPRKLIPTPDGDDFLGAFAADRNALRGDLAKLSLKLESDPLEAGSEDEGGGKLDEALADPAVRKKILNAIEKRVRKGLGAEYSVDPTIGARELTVTLATHFGETRGREATAKGIANVLEGLTQEIEGILEGSGVSPFVRSSWEPLPGLTNPTPLISQEGFEPELEMRQEFLLLRREEIARRRLNAIPPIVIAIGVAGVALALDRGLSVIELILIYAGIIALALMGYYAKQSARFAELENDIREVGNEIDLRETESDLDRAQKLFQAHAFEIKRYYDQALRQGRSIYYVGIGCIALGFAVVGIAFALVSGVDSGDVSEQIIVGSLGAIGAILANFIAVVYLRMFSETVKALTSFHQRLVVTHHLHFGNLLASKIEDEKLRESALAEMSKGLSTVASADFDQLTQANGARAAREGRETTS